jgi:cellulose synthase/poly-beta-1,6-N-acetylglucosamine synthase-like glycosyltransferase
MLKPAFFFLWNAVAALAACLSLPGSLELLTLSIGSLLPRQRFGVTIGPGRWRTAVLVPAHNEHATITQCLQALFGSQAAPAGIEVAIFVVADNCTDDTAALAALAGAQVLVRNDVQNRGKGYALHWAFTRLIEEGYDCMLIVDADTVVDPNFIGLAADTMRRGAQAVQARYLVRNTQETNRTRLMRLALRLFNVVRPLGRANLGLSCGINGNGFGLRSDTLIAVPYLATSIVEDLEYHLELVRSGRRVTFLNDATVYAETPVQAVAVEGQRSRWEGGRFRMLITQAPSLLRDVLSGKLRCIEPLFELLLLPLAYHFILVVVASSAPLPIVRYIGLAGLCAVLLHLVAGLIVGGGGWSDVAVLASIPYYLLWKLRMIPTLLRSARPDKQWVRTGRNAEQAAKASSRKTE